MPTPRERTTETCLRAGGGSGRAFAARRLVWDFMGERAGFACLEGLPNVVLRRRGDRRMFCAVSWRRFGDSGVGIGGILTVSFSEMVSFVKG